MTNDIAISRKLQAAGMEQKAADAVAEAIVTHSNENAITISRKLQAAGMEQKAADAVAKAIVTYC